MFAAFSDLVEAANQLHQGNEACFVTRRFSRHLTLLIVDEASRLKDAGLEVIRDIADRGKFGLVLLGMPGLDKRLARAPQLYSRIGFAQKIEPWSDDETRFFLDQRWSHRVSAHSDDCTDQEAVAAIMWNTLVLLFYRVRRTTSRGIMAFFSWRFVDNCCGVGPAGVGTSASC